MAELAAPATPVFPLLLQRALTLLQAEEVEGLAANLTVNKLHMSTAGAEETHHPGSDGYRGQDAKSTQFPHILHITVLLEIHSDPVDSIQ